MAYLSWTAPTAGEHPRIWINDTNGPSVSSVIAKATGSHAAYYNYVKSYFTSTILGYTDGWYATKKCEWTAALGLIWLVEGSTTHADKAISVAMHLAATAPPGADNIERTRDQCLMMAFAYDYCYSRMSSSQRDTVRSGGSYSLEDRINYLRQIDSDEYMWGWSHGNSVYATSALCAILNDGTPSENTTWSAWMDSLLDVHDNGTQSNSIGACMRYFGDSDGGSYKGAGVYSYSTRLEQFYIRMLPAIQSALNLDPWTINPWWAKLIDWHLWHWRGDRCYGHTEGDGLRYSQYRADSEAHCHLVAAEYDDARGNQAAWLASEMRAVNNYRIWGPYHLWSVLWRDLTRNPSAVRPTVDGTGIATTGTNQMKAFDNARKICIRTGFGETDTSFTIGCARFTGGHSQRDAGHFELATEGDPLCVRHGYYDPAQRVRYQLRDDNEDTGHVFTYYKRSIAHSVVRIMDSDEPAENQLESFQDQFSGETFFGLRYNSTDVISNVGDQLWPKDITNTKYQPSDLNHFLTTGKWQQGSFSITPVETSTHCYAVLDLEDFYYAGKCSRYKRHVLWIKPGVINASWTKPIILIWDDLETHIDSYYDKMTAVYQLQVMVEPTGTFPELVFPRANGKLLHRTILPASGSWRQVAGFFDLVRIYPPTRTGSWDDSAKADNIMRVEIWPQTATTTPQFLHVLYPMASSVQSEDAPAVTLYETPTRVGVQFTDDGYYAWMQKGDSHAANVETTAPPLPPPTQPSPPTGLTATGGNGTVAVDWNDNAESDLDYYKIYRCYETAPSVWSAWAYLDDAVDSEYDDNSVSNGTTYKYYVTAVNTYPVESEPSEESNEVTPQDPPPPPPDPPPTPGAYDNRLLAAGHHPCTCPPPVPSGDASITEGDKAQCCWCYRFDYGPPPVDYSDGDPISCDCIATETGGCMTDNYGTTPQSGSTIDDAEPTTPEEGEEISDATQ